MANTSDNAWAVSCNGSAGSAGVAAAKRGLPRTCIIGAGSSGIAAAKALLDRGVPFDCFEKSDQVGGNWVFGNRNGMSAAYRDLFINVSRERMAYADYPMPTSYPDFPHHTHIKEYFDNYVDHFGLREHITFETGRRARAQARRRSLGGKARHGGDAHRMTP